MIDVDAILFDLDGTLIDSRRDLANAVQWLQKESGARVSPEAEVASFVGDGVVTLITRALPGVEGKPLQSAVERFKEHYRIHCTEHTRPYPGVMELLPELRRKKLAIVTNKPWRISRTILERLDMLSYFPLIVGGDSLKTKKPDPGPVVWAVRELGLDDTRRVVMVGDSANDVLAGRGAGTVTCGVYSNIGDHAELRKSRPDLILHALNELSKNIAL
jgi:phosphoglycolate phosphatase